MVYSADFQALRKRLKDLRQRFLPHRFSRTGAYSSEQLDGARAYRLLCHAEIEHYLERRVLEIADVARDAWITRRKLSKPMTHLLACYSGDLGKVTQARFDVDSIAGTVFARFRHHVRKNHGIKMHDVRELTLPVGFEEADLDPALLSTLEGYGTSRGDAAHSSSVTYTVDPRSDFDTINVVVEGLKSVDGTLSSLLASCR